MSEVQEQIEDAEFTEVNEVSVYEALSSKIQAITKCGPAEAAEVTQLVTAVTSEVLNNVLNDESFMLSLHSNILIAQHNAFNRLRNLSEAARRREYIVLEEPTDTSSIRVHYVEADQSTWYLEQRTQAGWAECTLDDRTQANLMAVAGKFFDSRSGRYGYIDVIVTDPK